MATSVKIAYKEEKKNDDASVMGFKSVLSERSGLKRIETSISKENQKRNEDVNFWVPIRTFWSVANFRLRV